MQNNESFNKLYDGFRLRPATEGESAELIEVVREVFVEYGWIFDATDELPDFVQFDKYYAGNVPAKDKPFLCAVDMPDKQGAVAGCIALKFDHEGPCLSRVYLRKQYRGRGVGKWMVREYMEMLRLQGYGSLHLWTDTRFVPAHRMYEKVGFRMAGEIRSLHDINRSFEWKMVISLL
jgi:GNAT superfamily N-acetyltransferase